MEQIGTKSEILRARTARVLPDLSGEYYTDTLGRLHGTLRPQSYFEVGVFKGGTLRLARCASIAVDPAFDFDSAAVFRDVVGKPALHLFQMTSDDFFTTHSPSSIFGRPIDMAFLDGMHRCEFLLRDFLNTEKHCRRNSVVALHDCLPVEVPMTSRRQGEGTAIMDHRGPWWTGDVWRTALLLKRRRPDLEMTVVDAAPTGLMLVTNLDSTNTELDDHYFASVDEMMSWDLAEIGIAEYFAEMNVVSTATLGSGEAITQRFWL